MDTSLGGLLLNACRDNRSVQGQSSQNAALLLATLVDVPRFELVTSISAPVAACFDLSLSVDAHAASMGRSGERPIAGVMSGAMSLGDTVTWQGRHFGLRFRLTSTISAYERPVRFVDVQIRGPFAHWRHEHLFEAVSAQETRMVDRVDFRSPARPIGVLVDRWLLDDYMRALIRRRNAYLATSLNAGSQRPGD